MKKITFILFALIAGTTFAQSTTVSTAAEIIEAITFTEIAGLNFGKVDNTAGSVIISTTGGVTGTKTQVSGGTTSAAELTVSGAANETYSITVPTTTTLTGPGTALNVTGLNHNSTGNLDATTGEETVNIGGTLTVPGGQTIGAYSGTISVTVSYN